MQSIATEYSDSSMPILQKRIQDFFTRKLSSKKNNWECTRSYQNESTSTIKRGKDVDG